MVAGGRRTRVFSGLRKAKERVDMITMSDLNDE